MIIPFKITLKFPINGHISALKKILKSSNSFAKGVMEFISVFLSEQGLTHLMHYKNSQEWLKPRDIELGILRIMRVIIDKYEKFGADSLIEHSHAINFIMDCFDNVDPSCRTLTVRLLSVMCAVSERGHAQVKLSFLSDCTRFSAVADTLFNRHE